MSAPPSGVWLLPEDAAKYLGVPFDSQRQFEKTSTLNMSRYFERGADCSSAAPFSNFEYVCVLKNAPTGWKASANTPMTLPEFINLCEHLSHKQNLSSSDGIISTKFETYTGKLFNPLNVSAAFNDEVLYSC